MNLNTPDAFNNLLYDPDEKNDIPYLSKTPLAALTAAAINEGFSPDAKGVNFKLEGLLYRLKLAKSEVDNINDPDNEVMKENPTQLYNMAQWSLRDLVKELEGIMATLRGFEK